MSWSSHSCISKETFTIDTLTALKPSLKHDRQYWYNRYDYMEIVTKIKVQIKQALH